jgi:hypothetical protein
MHAQAKILYRAHVKTRLHTFHYVYLHYVTACVTVAVSSFSCYIRGNGGGSGDDEVIGGLVKVSKGRERGSAGRVVANN